MRIRSHHLIWALLLAATPALAQTIPAGREAIDVYRKAITAAESGASPRRIESVFTAIDDLRGVLLADVPGGTRSVLESLPEADFAQLIELPGLFVQRIEALVINPDPDFFVDLAARVGDKADQRFASTLAATYRNAKWPIYVEPQTDYSGCTVFGEGRLLETYLNWLDMARDFPGRYASAVTRERGRVQDAIATSTCACGDAASVVRELERIAAALNPADPMLPTVRERLAALDEGGSNIRFGCISG